MNNTKMLTKLAEADAYHGDTALPESIWTSDLALREIERRAAIQTRKHSPPVAPPRSHRRGWLIAIAAFAVVIVSLGATMLLTNSIDELPPATSPPTTRAAPPTSEARVDDLVEETTVTTVASAASGVPTDAELSLAETIVEAFNARDDKTIISSLGQPLTLKTALHGQVNDAEIFRNELAYRWAFNETWVLEGCLVEYGTTVCDIEQSGDRLPHMDGPVPTTLRLKAEDGEITSFILIENLGSVIAWDAKFYDWVTENHPGKIDLIRTRAGSVGEALATAESIALWVVLLPEYKATLDR